MSNRAESSDVRRHLISKDFHIILDLGADADARVLGVPGVDYQLIDLDTQRPLLRVGHTHWQGRWDRQVGTELVYESVVDDQGEEKAVEVCKCVKRLIFDRIYLQPRKG
ncbi:MAG: hypothetical protein DHS80DRAFT_31243 [Piptocephalis tieghemiana]|nr:MAG: hypothetical protein DHS80DRAFT_31243 [Piptocephalis tieghemiana]